ncbi:MAG TPA: type I restriction endonuclease [Chloroflexota bacterium]|nr:type I restriction endonuclease [Chloroflexota bacterium]
MTPNPNESTEVERPLIQQLVGLGWAYLAGSLDDPAFTERQNFKEVLLTDRLREAIRRINLDEDGVPWLDDERVQEALSAIERLGSPKLMEANGHATELLIKGTVVAGDPDRHGGRDQTARFIDFDHPEHNDFLVINQFRVDPPWAVGRRDSIIPDVVLFVNGIPLVVIECKSPSITDPMGEGIDQLLRYSNQRDWAGDEEGVERLFHYNQLMVSTWFFQAKAATIGAPVEQYVEWKGTYPVPLGEVRAALGVDELSSQQLLVAGMLRPTHLLDLVRNFTLFQHSGGRTIKIAGRYQQFRAVQKAIYRLQTGRTQRESGELDERGGIVWHTQGSGKSLTMVFLVRKMRTIPELRRYKIVVVTDRKDLQRQLSNTASLTGETVRVATSTNDLKQVLAELGPELVFATIQKYRQRDEEPTRLSVTRGLRGAQPGLAAAEERSDYRVSEGEASEELSLSEEKFPVLNQSEEILVLVDEAHRSQSSDLHANLERALPNSARIGFTGTPIILSERKRTVQIFGEYIDIYSIKQSEDDGVTVPILYEGRTAEAAVSGGRTLDQHFEDMFTERTPEEIEAIKRKYATTGDVLEAPKLIAAKARDILRHYVDNVLPEGFKAQLVAVSRLAAIRYQSALVDAKRELLAELEALDPAFADLADDEVSRLDAVTQFLARALPHIAAIRQLEFVTVISGNHNDPREYHEWTDQAKQEARIERFKRPLTHADPAKQDGLAFLCVKSMYLTGFDAPVEQVLYLDRYMHGHELLQAIARVNRTYQDKQHGLVVDYFGVARHLHEALAVYSVDDVRGALVSIRDELPKLRDRHIRVIEVFRARGIVDIRDIGACVNLLHDLRIRAEFTLKLKQFLESLNIVLPRPEALDFTTDAKILGFIDKAASNLYRDSQLNISGVGHKVQELIDRHIEAQGVDPKVPPISILDASFWSVVDQRTSSRTKASEMEHAARHYINQHFNEDPVRYQKLSDRLGEILDRFENNWDQLALELRPLTDEIRQGRQEDTSGLDPATELPFRDLLAAESESADDQAQDLTRLDKLTIEMVAYIRDEIGIVDFWRNAGAQNRLRTWIVEYLDDHDLVLFREQSRVADLIVELAKANQSRLTP